MSNFIDRSKIQLLWRSASTSGGTGAASTWIDVAGWNSCAFIITTCTQIDTTGSFVVINSSAESTGAGVLTYTTDLAIEFTTGMIQGMVLEVRNPRKRYLAIQPKWSTGRLYGLAVCSQGRRQGDTGDMHDNLSTGIGGFNKYKVYNWSTA